MPHEMDWVQMGRIRKSKSAMLQKMARLSWELLKAGNILSMIRPRHVLWNFLWIQMFNTYTCVTAVECAPFQVQALKDRKKQTSVRKQTWIFVGFDSILINFISLRVWKCTKHGWTIRHLSALKNRQKRRTWLIALGWENCRFQAWKSSFPKPLQWRFGSLPQVFQPKGNFRNKFMLMMSHYSSM